MVEWLCPNCKGKGHVLAGVVGPGGPFVWLFALFERNDPDGLTRDVCRQCDGRGYISSCDRQRREHEAARRIALRWRERAQRISE
jgi:DnaJ-class molecular chaperone